MASMMLVQRGLETEITVRLDPTDHLPLHPDLTLRNRLKMAWLVLLGREVRLSGPFSWTMKTSEPPQVGRFQ